MVLPFSDKLEIGYLSRIFDRNRISTCYKYYWFLAILEHISEDKTEFTYDELITEMITEAWYTVIEYKLRLGPCNTKDNLEEVVNYLYLDYFKEGVRSTEKKSVLYNKLLFITDKKYNDYKEVLINNVPYCLQSTFYPQIKNPSKKEIDRINQVKRLLYYFGEFDKLNTKVIVPNLWAKYMIDNKEILRDWARYNLINYLQDRNPSVPGINEKILPPERRNLNRVTKYWNTVIRVDPSITEIYGNNLLVDEPISIDHFIPWQYVAHDELWNLSPTTKSINSEKSNHLPNWDKYFKKLVEIEYKAYSLRYSNDAVASAFRNCEDYHLNNLEIRNTLYVDNLDINDFYTRLENVIKPVYESAKNCGFTEW